MPIKTVGVLGAGVMGAGLAQNLAQSGHLVVLVDVSTTVLDRARARIVEGCRMQRLLARKPGLPEHLETLELIKFTIRLDDVSGVDYVVENVTERWDVKKPLYARLDQICRPEVVFAANTSCIPITQIGAATNRANKVIGTHFMNPVPLSRAVEVIRGKHTSDNTVDITRQLITELGKACIVVSDAPGFVSNRVLMLTINEAVRLVQEGVASAEDVDRIFTSCMQHKLGPLATADLIGLDTIVLSLEVLREHIDDLKFRPCDLLRDMVGKGLLGQKTGKGFYSYQTSTSVR